MRITFISQARFPTEKAHGHQMAQVCTALTRLGHDVTLLAPNVQNSLEESAHGYYGLPKELRIEKISVFDALKAWWIPGAFAFSFTMRSYGRALRHWLRAHPSDVLYTRSPRLLKALLLTEIPVILELHTLPRRSRSFVRQCNACRLIVCLTEPMRSVLLSWGVHVKHVMVEGDGVDLERFEHMPLPATAKAEWKVPIDRAIIGYVGSLVTRGTIEKGVRELIAAVAVVREERKAGGLQGRRFAGQEGRKGDDLERQKVGKAEGSSASSSPPFLWIIGGPRAAIGHYRRLAEKLGLGAADVRFEGPVRGDRIPSALAACDVCVYPAPASRHAFFQRDTSPLKIFEYLAAGKPTVCADIPPLKGVIDPSLVHLCIPGDVASLKAAIAAALDHPKSHEALRASLLRHVSWEARMQRVFSALVFTAKK